MKYLRTKQPIQSAINHPLFNSTLCDDSSALPTPKIIIYNNHGRPRIIKLSDIFVENSHSGIAEMLAEEMLDLFALTESADSQPN